MGLWTLCRCVLRLGSNRCLHFRFDSGVIYQTTRWACPGPIGYISEEKGIMSASEGRLSQGRLSKDKFGYGMPVDAPMYSRPPIFYRNAQTLFVNYETDREAALDLLPQGLELPEMATALILFIRYPFSTLGVYEETILGLPCTHNGAGNLYIAHIVVNNEIPMVAGREIWGFPKKMATIEIKEEADIIWGRMERPKGNPICSAGVRLEKQIQEKGTDGTSLSLRVMPNPEGEGPPSLAELVQSPSSNIEVLESWQGTGWVQYHSNSELDPWHKLPVIKVLGAGLRKTNFTLGPGKVVKTY